MSLSERNIFLVRHAKPELPDMEPRFLGRTDLPLCAEGREQAERLREALAGVAFTAAYASGLSRANETAAAVARGRGLSVQIVPELAEIDCGIFECLSMSEMRARYPEEDKKRAADLYRYRVPGGESFEDVEARAIPALLAIAAQTEGNALVVAHAGVMRICLAHLLDMARENTFKLYIPYCGVAILGIHSRRGLTLRSLNRYTDEKELF